MNFNNLYTQWSTAFRDLTVAQFGLFMDGWKAMEKAAQDWKK